jgi:hypothetical protein
MVEYALEYLGMGYPVFPVCSPLMGLHQHRRNGKLADCPPDKRGKYPMTSWKDCQTELPSADEVRSWWRRWPLANIGMATGRLPGIVVLDCDSGEARRLALERGGLERTPAVWTGTPGGTHFWMAHPGYDVRNFAKEIPGTDFRGDGGYVLLPPSLHHKGARYRWVENTVGMDLAPVPDWLDHLFQAKAAPAAGGVVGEPLDVDAMLQGFPEGERDTGIFKLACRFRQEDQPQAYAEALIQVAAKNCRPAFDADEAVAKVRYVYGKYEAGGISPTVEMTEADWFRPDGGTAEAVIGHAESDNEAERWKVYDAADFLALEYPVVQWRIQGFLRDRAILFNFGAPGSIKTYIATDGALAVATGGLFLGEYQCGQGRVLIVQEDTLDSDFQQAYLGPLVRARGIDPEDLRGHLFVAPPGGMTLGVPERVQELCRWLEEYKPDLLIMDAFYLMHDGEGYGKDLGPIMKRLKAIRGAYNCAIWVIDHDRKGKAEGSSSENPIDRLWGGRQKSAAVDAIMESRPIKGSHGETFLDVIKLRGAKPADPIRVKLYSDYRLLVEGEGRAEEASPSGTRLAVYEWLCREGGSRTKAQMSTGVNLSLRAIEGALYELYRDGLAKKNGKVGRAETWIGLRKGEAEPITDGPDFDWSEDE